MTTTPAITGSISTGTLRPQDLAEAFLAALWTLDPDAANELSLFGTIVHMDDAEQADEFLDMLENAINESLPEGWYFGAHEGDGADFGIWREEEGEF